MAVPWRLRISVVQARDWAMELRMPVRASVAGMLGVLVVIGAACVGGTPSSRPEPTVPQESPPVLSPAPAPSPVAAVANPTLIPAVVPSPVASPSPAGGPRVRVVGAGAEGVNLRAEPSASGAPLKGLFDGAELELLGEDVEADGRTWRHVRDPTDRSEGWVAAEFLGPAE